MNTVAIDLRFCSEGVTCDEFSLLTIAGPWPYRKDLPPEVIERMDRHEAACEYHQSAGWHRSAVDTPVTEPMKKGAMEIVNRFLLNRID